MRINRLALGVLNSVVTSRLSIGRDLSAQANSSAWAFPQYRDALKALFSHSYPATFHGACQDLTERTWRQSRQPDLPPPARACLQETSRSGAELTRLNCNYKVVEFASAPRMPQAATVLKPLNAPLESAVSKLNGDPRTTLYEGMRLTPSGQDILTSAAAQWVPYSFSRVLSATSDDSSLCGPERGIQAPLVIHNAPHVKLDEFHPDSHASQSECIVLAEHTWRTCLNQGSSKSELESLLFAKNMPSSGVFTARCG